LIPRCSRDVLAVTGRIDGELVVQRVVGPILLIVFGAVAAIPAAPRLKERTDLSYFPTEVGTQWVYEAGNIEVTRFVRQAEKVDGATLITIGQVNTRKPPHIIQRLRVSNQGIFEVENYLGEVDPPRCLLRLPHRTGSRWGYNRRKDTTALWFDDEEATAHEEEVVVPAGRFRAIRVESQHRKGGKPEETHAIWYAPGVGPVKCTAGSSPPMLLKCFGVGD
jgi:hypothetical protein